jgi:hypothetical protein
LTATLCLLSLSINSDAADSFYSSPGSQTTAFIFQHKTASVIPERPATMPQFFGDASLKLDYQAAYQEDAHLLFNTLWLQESQQYYDYDEGGAAVGKLFRIGLKTWYRSYRSANRQSNLPDENGSGAVSNDIDYRVRLSSDRVKLQFNYEF